MELKKSKAFRLMCYATVVSSFGDSLYSLACTLTVYALSGSLVGVAGMWLIRALIRIPSQFISGIVADRCNRKKVSVYIYFISAVLVSLFPLLDENYLAIAFALIFILQGTSDMDNMAQAAMLPELIDKEQLQSANGIFQTIGTVVMLIGPGVGGFLYKFLGSDILYFIDAVTFVIAAFVMMAIPYRYEKEEKKKAEFTLFKFAGEGIVEIKKHSVVKVMILSTVFFGILGRFYEIDKVYMADKVLGIGAEGIVYFSYAMAIGSLLAPMFLKIINKEDNRKKPIQMYVILSILTSIGYMAWGNSKSLLWCLLANVIFGIFNTGMSIYTNLIFQRYIDNKCIGRVMSFYKISIVLSAIVGVLLAPTLVNVMGVGGSMVIVGGMAIVFVTIMWLISLKKRNADVANATS